jgi:hypothetical protein
MRIRVWEWQGVKAGMIGLGLDLNGAVYVVDNAPYLLLS